MGSVSHKNTFQSDDSQQNIAQDDKPIGTQINNYAPQAVPPDKPQPKSSVRMVILICVLIGAALFAAKYHSAQFHNQSKAVTQINPAIKTEPPTVVVDARKQGDYTTITDALKVVKAGTRILVRPGLYKEGIVIDKPVEIIGDGEQGDIVIEASGKHTVLFQADNGKVANLTLRQAGGKWCSVNVIQGRLELEDCDISSQGRACVAIHGSADPNLRHNRIYDGKSAGVSVYKNGQGTLEDNEIFANAKAGVAISQGGNPTLRRNGISKNGWQGIRVSDKGGGIFEDNDLRGNAAGAWDIAPGCESRVQRRGNKE